MTIRKQQIEIFRFLFTVLQEVDIAELKAAGLDYSIVEQLSDLQKDSTSKGKGKIIKRKGQISSLYKQRYRVCVLMLS